MTDVTKNSRLFAVTSTTWSTLLLAVCLKLFFPSIDIQQALVLIVQHTQRPCRLVILRSDKSSVVTSFETDVYIRRKYTRYEVHTCAVYSCVWHQGVFLEHGGEALGIFKSPVLHFVRFRSHYFSFLSEAPCSMYVPVPGIRKL